MTAAKPNLILPGDPEFDVTLGCTIPPNWRHYAENHPDFAFVARAGQGGVLTPMNWDEVEEYLEGGEYEERLLESEDDDLIEEFYSEFD